ncbi:NAD(P)-dependent oxidoreductase [Hyphomonas sp.]|uniref:NAD-dependent epimerase/dehydratase family protein n=1 Tax=Hyphomonas sp. TaxID=87 RepID=UPI0032F02E1D
MSAMRVLVTGASGFIGQALVARLVSEGHSVIALNRSSARGNAGGSISYEERLAPTPEDLVDALRDTHPDLVIHAAAPGTRPADRTWQKLAEGCVQYVHQLFDGLASQPPKRFVLLGSWSEYAPPAGPEGTLISESHPLESGNLYGAHKAASYLIAQARAAQLGVEFVSARLFNIFGPGENCDRLVPYCVRQLRAGRPVDLTSGEQKRDFVFIDDAVDAILRLALRDPAPDAPVYNVCSGVGVSVKTLILTAAEAAGGDLDLLKFGALPQRGDEPMEIAGNPRRLANLTGWAPQTPISTGIKRLVSHTLSTGLQHD